MSWRLRPSPLVEILVVNEISTRIFSGPREVELILELDSAAGNTGQGGGSRFGVITSRVIKAFPSPQMQSVRWAAGINANPTGPKFKGTLVIQQLVKFYANFLEWMGTGCIKIAQETALLWCQGSWATRF